MVAFYSFQKHVDNHVDSLVDNHVDSLVDNHVDSHVDSHVDKASRTFLFFKKIFYLDI
jgi:hypothetical protein